jgi:hypothetical protein
VEWGAARRETAQVLCAVAEWVAALQSDVVTAELARVLCEAAEWVAALVSGETSVSGYL